MPRRATSRWLLVTGIAFVIISGTLIVSPVLIGGPIVTRRLGDANAEMASIARSVDDIRDMADALREITAAQRAYLLTGAQSERNDYDALVPLTHKLLADLHGDAADIEPALAPNANQLLDDLARGAALQDAGRHQEAIVASNIDETEQLTAKIAAITRERIGVLRRRYAAKVQTIRNTNAENDEWTEILFGLAGASFSLGCFALVAYQRRHFAMQAILQAGRDAALEASVMKSRFIATASHDLRQPLHAISMFVGVLRRRSTEPAILSVIENIATAVGSMQRMFAALLDVARLDAGAVRIEQHDIALQDLFSTLEVEFVASAISKGLSLQIQPTTLSVTTDPALLETILRNLLSNALKFTDQGLVGITTRRRDDMVDIIVFDTGLGIAPKDQAKIFEQFERLSQHGGQREGLGLGLSIVQRMANMLGVTVSLQSEQGKGSQFTVSLPFAPGAEPEIVDAESSDGTAGLELRDQPILVLDDHSEARQAITLAVEALGAKPLVANSPEAAFELIAAMAPEVPRAAVVDHDLGDGETGPAFLDRFALRKGFALPAVVITGSTEASTLAALASSGRPWLIKPVDLDVLRLTLSRLIHPELSPDQPA